MTHRTDRVITNLVGQLEALGVEFDSAVQAIRDRIRHLDGYPGGIGKVGPRGTAELTSVEQAAARRESVKAIEKSLYDELDAIALTVRNLRQDCRRLAATPAAKPRCDSGANLGGYLVPRSEGGWSDPSCENIPPEGRPTCDACRKRAQRWKRAQETAAA